ncbi:hypothetical protein ACWEPL_32135 [Nonomuraea sp. NPDC004186]
MRGGAAGAADTVIVPGFARGRAPESNLIRRHPLKYASHRASSSACAYQPIAS